jgi:hypothetical protein
MPLKHGGRTTKTDEEIAEEAAASGAKMANFLVSRLRTSSKLG